MRTADIWSSTFSFSRMAGAETSRKDSTQSPAWRRNARPSQTSPSDARSARASPAKTSGGSEAKALAHCCERGVVRPLRLLVAGSARQDDGVQVDSVSAIGRRV